MRKICKWSSYAWKWSTARSQRGSWSDYSTCSPPGHCMIWSFPAACRRSGKRSGTTSVWCTPLFLRSQPASACGWRGMLAASAWIFSTRSLDACWRTPWCGGAANIRPVSGSRSAEWSARTTIASSVGSVRCSAGVGGAACVDGWQCWVWAVCWSLAAWWVASWSTARLRARTVNQWKSATRWRTSLARRHGCRCAPRSSSSGKSWPKTAGRASSPN